VSRAVLLVARLLADEHDVRPWRPFAEHCPRPRQAQIAPAAASGGLAVKRYEDRATGTLGKNANGQTQMAEVVLHPRVTIPRGADAAMARDLHDRAHHHCFMANSVNFPVRHEPEIVEE
jgi:organic hydroperoxide reductase OsmC/OhrA